MANGYQPPDDEPETPQDVPDEPEVAEPAEAAEAAEPAKISQQQANYRESDKTRCCGLCANFTGSAGEGAFQCTKVDGKISPFGFSDLYERQDNPFREGETGEFTGGVAVAPPPMAAVGGMMPAMPPPISPPAQPMPVRIGGKSYAG